MVVVQMSIEVSLIQLPGGQEHYLFNCKRVIYTDQPWVLPRNESHTISSLQMGHTSLELAAVTVPPFPTCTLLPMSFSGSGKGLVASGLDVSESRETVLSVWESRLEERW